jgi:hypothetical protein
MSRFLEWRKDSGNTYPIERVEASANLRLTSNGPYFQSKVR